MSAASSPGSERFVLARRGLPFAPGGRRLAPAPWLASFAFVRSRVPPRAGAQAVPGLEWPSAVPGEMEEAPYDNLPVSDDPRPDSETVPVHACAQKPEVRAQVELKTHVEPAAPLPTRGAPSEDKDSRARAAQASVGAHSVPASAAPAVEQAAAARAASSMRQAVAPPSLDQASLEANGHSRAPLGVGPSIATLGVAPDSAPSQAPPPGRPLVPETRVLRTATAPDAAALPMSEIAPAPVAAPAPASLAMPMGTPQASPRRDAGAAASRIEIAQLAERARARPAASAEGRIANRIGTVQIVVRTESPEPRPVPPAAKQALLHGGAPVQAPAARPFRSPWASSRWRGD